jgi:hypothetical protein
MASRRCTDGQARPSAFLDVTSVTRDAFPQFVPPCETAFHTHLAAWRLDRKPRIARRFTVSLKASALQVVQGRLFGMGHSKAHQWMHVLLPTLLAALRALGVAPARSLTALAQRVGVSEADAATVVVPLEEAPAPVVAVPAAASASPLVPMTAPNDASSAPTTLLNRRSVRAAKKGPHGQQCPARQCPAPHPLSARHVRRSRP